MTTPTRPFGMHPLAFAAYVAAGLPVDRIGQTIGGAAASAGTHEKDGEYEGHDYAACTDLRIADLTDEQVITDLLPKLADAGFAPFFRKPGVNHWPAGQARHVHMVWPGCAMKEIVRHQIHDFCHTPMLNGLASHVPYRGWNPTPAQVDVVRAAFLANNPADN